MSDFELYFKMGLWHVLNIKALDHILFLIALTLPYAFKEWRKVLLLVTLFTIGHTMSLILSVYGILNLKSEVTEFLIPLTILAAALFNLITHRRRNTTRMEDNVNFVAVVTLIFGVVHGMGFFTFFKMNIGETSEAMLLPVVEFALGIEAAQVAIVLMVLAISGTIIEFLRIARRDWILVMSSFVIGVVVPLIIHSEIW